MVTPLPSNVANKEVLWLTHCDNYFCSIYGIWEWRFEPERLPPRLFGACCVNIKLKDLCKILIFFKSFINLILKAN
jgi:hypothetical protein